MLNQFAAVARLTGDPELRKTNSDVSFVTFSVAIDNPVKEADGTRGTCFLDARAFNAQAENIARCLHKGSKVALSGSLNQRNFERKDGSKGRAYEIIIDNIEFLDPKPETEDEEVKEAEPVKPKPKYDPMTGKPLNPVEKA